MKILITINVEINGYGLPEVKLVEQKERSFLETQIEKDNPLKPEMFENLRRFSRGLSFDEVVPDEETPPDNSIAVNGDEITRVEFKEEKKVIPGTVETVFPKDFEVPVKKKRGKRGPYKKRVSKSKVKTDMPSITKTENTGKKPESKTSKPPSDYPARMIESSLVEGRYLEHLKGVQATPKKFIAQGVYFQGSLNEAKKAYKKYALDEIKSGGVEVLVFESWLTKEWLSGEK